MPSGTTPGQAGLLAGLFGPGTAVSGLPLSAESPALFPAEEAAMARAVPARRREFAAGRAAARAAMAALGLPPAAIAMGEDRAPIWPSGLIGSISHNSTLAACVVSKLETNSALGLDLEDDAPLPRDLWPTILLPAEEDWLHSQQAAARGRLARLIFSAKECAYKAQYGLSGQLLDFPAFLVQLDLASGRFQAVFQHDVAPFESGEALKGRFLLTPGCLATAITLARR